MAAVKHKSYVLVVAVFVVSHICSAYYPMPRYLRQEAIRHRIGQIQTRQMYPQTQCSHRRSMPRIQSRQSSGPIKIVGPDINLSSPKYKAMLRSMVAANKTGNAGYSMALSRSPKYGPSQQAYPQSRSKSSARDMNGFTNTAQTDQSKVKYKIVKVPVVETKGIFSKVTNAAKVTKDAVLNAPRFIFRRYKNSLRKLLNGSKRRVSADEGIISNSNTNDDHYNSYYRKMKGAKYFWDDDDIETKQRRANRMNYYYGGKTTKINQGMRPSSYAKYAYNPYQSDSKVDSGFFSGFFDDHDNHHYF